MDETLRRQLLDLRERDRSKRRELVERGELFEGYHPEMQAVHEENARRLASMLDRRGWPSPDEVGEDGAGAAALVAQHAIGLPSFQRRCRDLLVRAVEAGRARPADLAMLVDRIRYDERRPQVHGCLLDWDAEGRLSPWTIEDPGSVDERRRRVGLPPLEESVREARENARREGGRASKPFAERQAEIEAWARRVGWLDD
jgi:hypothetical protein